MKKTNIHHENALAEERFRFYFLVYRNMGMPLTSRRNSKVYTLYSAFTTLCAYSFFIAMILDLINYIDDLKHIMENVQACTGIAVTLWMHICIRLQRDKFVKLMVLTNSFTWEDLPITSSGDDNRNMTSMAARVKKNVKQMFLLLFLFHGSYIVIRLIFSKQRLLTANSFYILDVTRSPVYELVILSQIIAAAFYSVMFFGLWGMYATFIYVACIQLNKLRVDLFDIRQKEDTSEQDSGADSEQEDKEQVHTSHDIVHNMHKQLNDCIRHHQQILSFMHAIEDVFSPILLGVFFISTTSVCLCGFSMAMNLGNIMAMSQAALVYVALMFLLSTFCQLGEELTRQADSIRDAVWDSNWVGAPVSFQHCLVFIILIAGKKFSLTAGKFVTVSNQTLLNIFNESISFFMFLLNVKDKNDHHTSVI